MGGGGLSMNLSQYSDGVGCMTPGVYVCRRLRVFACAGQYPTPTITMPLQMLYDGYDKTVRWLHWRQGAFGFPFISCSSTENCQWAPFAQYIYLPTRWRWQIVDWNVIDRHGTGRKMLRIMWRKKRKQAIKILLVWAGLSLYICVGRYGMIWNHLFVVHSHIRVEPSL